MIQEVGMVPWITSPVFVAEDIVLMRISDSSKKILKKFSVTTVRRKEE